MMLRNYDNDKRKNKSYDKLNINVNEKYQSRKLLQRILISNHFSIIKQ